MDGSPRLWHLEGDVGGGDRAGALERRGQRRRGRAAERDVALIGPLPFLLGIDYYSNVKRPATATKSEMRFLVALLYPKGKQQ